MKVKNINSSSIKTNRAIKEAFAELMKEKKSLNNITVTSLVKKADITRSAFYTHYDSIYDVAEELQNETLDVLMNNLDGIKTIDDFNHYFDIIFNYLKENERIYGMLLSSNDPLLFSNHLNKHFTKYILKSISNINEKNLELKISFYTDGCMNLLIKYFRKEIDSSLDEIKEFLKVLFNELFTQKI